MKRFLVLALVFALCITGCGKKQQPVTIPGGSEPPEGVDWKVWEEYVCHTMTMGEETVEVLISLDPICLAVYYDRDVQELLGSVTIMTPLSDVEYSRQRLRIMDVNGDGYDDISVPDMLANGDRIIECWVWDPDAQAYLYAPEYSLEQENIGADVSWRDGKQLMAGVWDTPEGGQDLLIWIDGEVIHIYRDRREETLLTQVQIPTELTEEAKAQMQARVFWDCQDVNGDGWGDLQLPYRMETTENGLFVYAYCWLWETEAQSFQLDQQRSRAPIQ